MSGAGHPRPARGVEARPGPETERLAHELRSALNGIQTWTQVLAGRLMRDADPEVLRALEGIADGVARQVRLIEEHLEGRSRS